MPRKLALEDKEFSVNEVVNGIRNREFFLIAQPQEYLFSSELFGFELLARWQHEHYGVVTPNKFIPVLESSGKCHLLTLYLFQRMLGVIQALGDLAEDLQFSLNISASDLDNSWLIDQLVDCAKRSVVPNYRITLEVTESLSILEFNRKDALHRLHDEGFLLAVDDFWTGFSSLETIRAGFFSEVKIDYSLTSQLINDATSMAGVNAIIQLSKDLDIHCIVEGIETNLVHAVLLEAGATIGQGYLFGAGVRDDELAGWIVEKKKKISETTGESPVVEIFSIKEAEFLETRRHPSWVWDFKRKKISWANTAGVNFWESNSLQELQSRNMSNMGYVIETRLESYRIRFENGEKEISAVWSLYPNQIPKTVFCIQVPRIDKESGELLLLINAFEGFRSRLNEKKFIEEVDTIPVPFLIASECGTLRQVNRHAHVELKIEPNNISNYFADSIFLAMKKACDSGQFYERFVELRQADSIRTVYLRAAKTLDKNQSGLNNYHIVVYPVPDYYENRLDDYR